MKLRPVTLAILALSAALASASSSAQEERRSYIIQLADKPVASYTGETAGYAATKPATGQRLDVDASTVQSYISYLDAKQASVSATVAGAEVTHKYNVVFNGFAALLTDAEVRALKQNPDVAAITADSIMTPDTSYTPTFLGIDQPNGLWSKVGGQGAAGEDIIIGIVDTGIWPENPSYADRVNDSGAPDHQGSKVVYGPVPASWKGSCASGEGFNQSNCNLKLIGARFFHSPTQTLDVTEFNSPRDSLGNGAGGHGTHTSTTAGGNAGVQAYTAAGVPIGKISGMAPRARIAAYKVCWTSAATPTAAAANGCATANSVAAIEQAVKDGVNVINFSIGSSAGGGSFSEATEQAFLGATNAGVFVATSAGNSGPTATAPAPVGHISPWLTTVGNSTHNRAFVGDAQLGNGVALTGASNNAFSPAAPLILASQAGMPGLTPSQQSFLALCYGAVDGTAYSGLLDPSKVTGKTLVCDRGGNVLVNKSAAGQAAGAVGVIIANTPTSANTTIVQSHQISTVHIDAAKGAVLRSYIANNGDAAASLGNLRGILDPTIPAPVMNGSSSRGPNVANANILKPDMTAPGTDILAAVTPSMTPAQRLAVIAGTAAPVTAYNFYTGTSMASPHVAGMAAVLKQSHPDWSPAMIKSALMTTAYNTKSDGLNGAMAWDTTAKSSGTLPWGQGAGHIAPNFANDPGLVFDIAPADYRKFMCGVGAGVDSATACQTIGTIAATNLNLPSVTVGALMGSLTVNRTVTNVGSSTATYTASGSGAGFTIETTPPSFTLAVGESANLRIKMTRTTAPLDTWAYGSLVMTDGTHIVRSPVTVRPSALSAIASVYSEATAGTKVITIGTGFTGPMTTIKSGLIPATQVSGTVGQAVRTTMTAVCKAGGGPGINVHDIVLPAGLMGVRFALFDEDTGGGSNSDLDLLVIAPNGGTASSGSGTSNEVITLNNPAAGTWKVCVQGYAPAGGSATYKLSSWQLAPGAINGNFKALTPAMAYIGGTGSVSMSWSGLGAGVRHLGLVRYLQNGVAQGQTLVDVQTNDPLPTFNNSRTTQVMAD